MATIAELAGRVGLSYEGDGGLEVTRVRGLETAGEHDLSFVQHPRFRQQALASPARALVAPEGMELPDKTVIRSPHPQLTVAELTPLLHPRAAPEPGVHPTAVVGRDCRLPASVSVGPHAVLGEGVDVGERSILAAGVYLGDGVRLGADCTLHPGVVVEWGCVLGDRVEVHAGTVIGSDGFGFIQHEGRHVKIPHVGNVTIGDDVEIGAQCTIDRATYDSTVVGAGSKLDNMVHLAHNVEVGPYSLFAGQSGIAGTGKVGRYFTMGGQSGVAGHVRVPDHVTVGPKSMMSRGGRSGEVYAGIPARPMQEWKRAVGHFYSLHRLVKRWNRLLGEAAPAGGPEGDDPERG